MDWAGWAVFGLLATAVLTAIMTGAQQAGMSRMDIPLLLGSAFVRNSDSARLAGTILHFIAGQVFALGYALSFLLLGMAHWWLGALFGLGHGLIALTVIVPPLAGFHRSMASDRAGPAITVSLEPPGLLALNYGRETPLVTLVAHVAYGALLGGLLMP